MDGSFLAPERLWIAAGTLAYGAALGGALGLLAARRQPDARVLHAVVGLGFLLQTIGLYLRGLAVGGCPLGNKFEIVQFVVWSCVVLYLVVGTAFRTSVLGLACAAFAGVGGIVSLVAPGWDTPYGRASFAGGPWIEFHAALAVFSYGVLALLALTSGLQVWQQRDLKARRGGFFARLVPPLVHLETINARLLVTATALLTVALAVGAVFWWDNWASVQLPKLAATLAVWLALLALLGLRGAGRLHGRRLSLACIAVFAAALLTLWPVNRSRTEPPPPPHAAP